jgi:RNA polymerase sigma-54 factor
MKPRLQTSLGQQLTLTPQLQLAIRLLQMSSLELEAEVGEALQSNPLLDWDEGSNADEPAPPGAPGEPPAQAETPADPRDDDDRGLSDLPRFDEGGDWSGSTGSTGGDEDDAYERQVAAPETLHDHLRWQLQMGPLPPRAQQIALALIDAVDEDGYLRAPLADIASALVPDIHAADAEILAVLAEVQAFDPPGVAARDLAECLSLQLHGLPDSPERALARRIIDEALAQIPKLGAAGIARVLGCEADACDAALELLRSLDPRPGARFDSGSGHDYVIPDCEVRRGRSGWDVRLVGDAWPRVRLAQGYRELMRHARDHDAGYLRQNLQEARWLLKGLRARAETLLRVCRSLVRQQSAFLEFGPQALRPLTLRDIAEQLGLHESTISRAVARKYIRTPRGTLPLRAFFSASLGGDGEAPQAASGAVQAMLRELVANEDAAQPLSDARLVEVLALSGIQVARRTVAKYRELMRIPPAAERMRRR